MSQADGAVDTRPLAPYLVLFDKVHRLLFEVVGAGRRASYPTEPLPKVGKVPNIVLVQPVLGREAHGTQ